VLMPLTVASSAPYTAPHGAPRVIPHVIPLVVHSAYSLLWGVPTPRRLVERAAEAGIHALALTDRNGLYGLPVFLRECRERGVRPIVGAELAAGWGRVVVIVRDRGGVFAPVAAFK